MNGANEAAVGLFLREKIGFLQIAEAVEHAMELDEFDPKSDLEAILAADRAARRAARKVFGDKR
jgi:1-deoxy-D-xylulose-5-phosphate reductoisomerase